MQLSTVVALLLASLVCVNCTAWVATVSYSTSTCTGTSLGGSAMPAMSACNKDAATGNYTANGCSTDLTKVTVLSCSDSACTKCSQIGTAPACVLNPDSSPATNYIATTCVAGPANLPAAPAGYFVQQEYAGASCVNTSLMFVLWAPAGVCIPNVPSSGMSVKGSCGTALTLASYATAANCTGANSTASIALAPTGCSPLGTGIVGNAICVTSAPTPAPTTTSHASTTGSHNATTTSHTATGSTSTTSSAASVVASAALFVVVAMIAAL